MPSAESTPPPDDRDRLAAARLLKRAMLHDADAMQAIADDHDDPRALAVSVATVAWAVLVMCSQEMVDGPTGAYGRPRFDLSLPLDLARSLERDYLTSADDDVIAEMEAGWEAPGR